MSSFDNGYRVRYTLYKQLAEQLQHRPAPVELPPGIYAGLRPGAPVHHQQRAGAAAARRRRLPRHRALRVHQRAQEQGDGPPRRPVVAVLHAGGVRERAAAVEED